MQQKKNQLGYIEPKYAQIEHYSYHVANIPESNGNKLFLYYKRYTPKGKLQNLIQEQESIYEAFQTFREADSQDKKQISDLEKSMPIAKTLMIINFDHKFEEEKVKKWFQLIGKVRKIEIGSYKNKSKTGAHKDAKMVHFALIVFKNEFDLIKVFDKNLLQTKFDEFFQFQKLKQTSDDKGAYLQNLLNSYEKNELNEEKQKEIEKLQAEGFQIVTDFKGGIDAPKQTIYDLQEEQNKKNKKQKKHILPELKNDFYNFQTKKRQLGEVYGEGEEDCATDKQFIARKKKLLIDQFQKDAEKLKQSKLQKQPQQQQLEEDSEDDNDDLL